jgi:hypothetical protein
MRVPVPAEFATRFQLHNLLDARLRRAAVARLQKYRVPLLSAFNGPSYLLHAVEALSALGISRAHIRLLPVIGRSLDPEVLPYYCRCNLANLDPVDFSRLRTRLCINVREDRRLLRFFALVAVGLPSQAAAANWLQNGIAPSAGFLRLCSRLDIVDPGWTNVESPAERLTRKLCNQYPELNREGPWLESPSEKILVRAADPTRRRYGPWDERDNPFFGTKYERVQVPDEPDIEVREIVDVFLTQAMLAVATADMMGGFAYELQVEPPGRRTQLTIERSSTPEAVLRWLKEYPHDPIDPCSFDDGSASVPPSSQGGQVEEDTDTPGGWKKFFAAHPGRFDLMDMSAKLWTEEDPAILGVYEQVLREYNCRDGKQQDLTARESNDTVTYKQSMISADRPSDPISTDQMLTFARRSLPEYAPRCPRQLCLTGGMNLEGALLTLMGKWLQDGPFLGVTLRDWREFSPEHQAILCALLVQRRQVVDQCSLFHTAAMLLVDPAIDMRIELFKTEAVRLGQSLAQPDRTLSLNGVLGLHAPSLELRVPLDRTLDPQAEDLDRKIKILARLFKPVNIPLKVIWTVDRPILGVATYLQNGPSSGSEFQPACRLGT